MIDSFLQDTLTDHEAFKLRVHVVREEENDTVLGFYALQPTAFGKRNYRDPAVELKILGVQLDRQGQGLGEALVADAFKNTYTAARAVGTRWMLVSAVDHKTTQYYANLGFEHLASGSLEMLVTIDTIVSLVEGQI